MFKRGQWVRVIFKESPACGEVGIVEDVDVHAPSDERVEVTFPHRAYPWTFAEEDLELTEGPA